MIHRDPPLERDEILAARGGLLAMQMASQGAFSQVPAQNQNAPSFRTVGRCDRGVTGEVPLLQAGWYSGGG